MTIIKKITSNNWFYIVSLSLAINSCVSPSKIVQASNNCKLIDIDITEYKLSAINSEIANSEIQNFFESNYKYDVLNYEGQSGESDYSIERWYYKSSDVLVHIKIINEKKSINEINIIENDLKILFEKLESQSFNKDCGGCYGCSHGLLLIKNKDFFFKYHYVGDFHEDLNQIEKNKIINSIEILNFFKNQ